MIPPPVGEPTGSRTRGSWVKATEGVKHLGMQHRRTLRRQGRGTVAQSLWEQERPVFAPAVSHAGRHPVWGLGAASPISGVPVQRISAERESERPIGLVRRGTTEPARREGAVLGRRAWWRYVLVIADKASDALDKVRELQRAL